VQLAQLVQQVVKAQQVWPEVKAQQVQQVVKALQGRQGFRPVIHPLSSPRLQQLGNSMERPVIFGMTFQVEAPRFGLRTEHDSPKRFC
jgi:hypothetical protein